VIGTVLVVYTGGVFLFLRASLFEELDRQLHDEVDLSAAALSRLGDGRVARLGGSASGPEQIGYGLDVWNLDGALLYSEGSEAPNLPRPGAAAFQSELERVETIRSASSSAFRARSARVQLDGLPVLLRVARPEEPLLDELYEFLVAAALGLPAAVGLACLGGYFLAGRALAPVGKMAARARTITAERLSERLPIENSHDELGRLGTVFNDTLARLERSFDSLRRFTADAAHELRTPLTALRSVGEVALGESSTSVAPETVGSMLEEVDRLSTLVDALLMLSRAEGGHVAVRAERFELRELACDAAEYLDVLATERGQRITVGGAEAAWVRADRQIVRQAVLNVLDNAIKHSPHGTGIRIVVGRAADEAVLEIIDEGPGIPSEHRERVFERFYRIDTARSRETGGAGLGLSISQWAIRANGGSIEVDDATSNGTCLRIRLPLDEPGSGTESARQQHAAPSDIRH